MRHIDVGMMWIQQERRAGEQGGGLKFTKVLGTKNPADVATKYLNKTTMGKILPIVGCEWRQGRAVEGLTLSRGLQ